MRSLALALIVAASLPAVHARAADALVLSIGGDAPAEVAEEARAAASAALEEDGASVVPHGEVVLRIAPSRLRGVASLGDARALAFELEARMIVGVAVWMRADADPTAADSVAVSLMVGARTFAATREIGEAGLAAASADAMHDVRGQQTRAVMIEGPGGDAGAANDADAAGGGEGEGEGEAGDPATPPRSQTGTADTTPAFDVIGPTMLGAFGAAGIGLGIYSVLDGTCERRAPISGDCLLGEEPNLAVGITLTVAGTLAVAGAIIWLATGAAVVADQPRIDVVLGPEGGAVSARGTF